MRIDHESRISFAIDWYDSEEEATDVGERVFDAKETRNGGFYHGMRLGRDRTFDREVDGQKQYAVTRS